MTLCAPAFSMDGASSAAGSMVISTVASFEPAGIVGRDGVGIASR